MKRLARALTIAFTVGLALLPGAAWPGDAFHSGLNAGVRSDHTGSGHGPHFIGHERDARPFVGQGQHFVGHERGRPHEFNSHPGFTRGHIGHPFGSTVIAVPRWVWVPGFWWWNGFDWVWAPGHWVFHGHTLLLRNPCD